MTPVMKDKKNSPPRRRAVLVDLYVCVSARLCLLLCHPNEKLPTFSEEVGLGRRERGNANRLYILGGILPFMMNMSMVLKIFIFKDSIQTNLVIRILSIFTVDFNLIQQ